MPATTHASATVIFSLSIAFDDCHCQRTGQWQARRESHPPPAVLETAALPIELLAFSRSPLLDDLRHDAGADGAAAFANREAQPLFHRDRLGSRHPQPHRVPTAPPPPPPPALS